MENNLGSNFYNNLNGKIVKIQELLQKTSQKMLLLFNCETVKSTTNINNVRCVQ